MRYIAYSSGHGGDGHLSVKGPEKKARLLLATVSAALQLRVWYSYNLFFGSALESKEIQ